MVTEFEVWNLFWLASLANAAWMAGLAFLIWVTFRAANMVGESDNIFSKAVVTVFCLVIDYQVNFTLAAVEWANNGVAEAFAFMQSSGTEISEGAQRFVEYWSPGTPFNLIPDVVGGLLVLTILLMQMSSIWMKK